MMDQWRASAMVESSSGGGPARMKWLLPWTICGLDSAARNSARSEDGETKVAAA
jgi:hypothetical protein